MNIAELVEDGLHSFMCVPLLTRNRVVGTILMGARMFGYYTNGQMALMQRIGSQLAAAMANARLDAERTELEEQLIQAQKMEAIGRLAGGIAHDFNNLLTPILGFSQLGMTRLDPDNPATHYLEKIHDAADRATHLIRQLLMFSRKKLMEPKVISISRLIVNMDGIMRRLINEDIDLITRPKPDLGYTLIDPGQMEQVLVNLVVNASDAMPGGGRIIIETDDVSIGRSGMHAGHVLPTGEWVRLCVRDNGIGMSDEVKRRIFDPFFTTKDVGKGTGLGLSTCYGIVNQVGGCIFVDSVVGQGSTFTVYLPRYEGALPEITERTGIPASLTGTETILLVEDELAVREIASFILREQGYTVLEASNGSQALDLLDKESPHTDLLLTDVVMPGMGGRELADHLSERRPGIKIVYMSGYTDETIADHGIIKGGATFLQKPFRPDELAWTVRTELDKC
jgi:signal transduction histidine kinase/CheY-like chemotaxis protein